MSRRALRRTARPAWVAATVLALGGCGDLLLPADPADGPEAVARALWEEVDAYYPFFEHKGIDWDAVGAEYLPKVTPATKDRELWTTLSAMLATLRDGHVSLQSPYGRSAWEGWFRDHPANYDPAVARHYLLPGGNAVAGTVWWGRVADGVGYLHIETFGVDGIGAGVDAGLAALEGVNGLIVDVRGNGGGSDTQSEAAAGRFAHEPVVYRVVRYKTGPGREDFGPELTTTLRPAGAKRFIGPVVVLQNRGVYSAAEDFVLAMRQLPNTTFVGDTTGGGSGNPIGRELPNGWVARIPRWRLWTPQGTMFEGVGLAPDEVVSSTEYGQGRDAILERAIDILQGR